MSKGDIETMLSKLEVPLQQVVIEEGIKLFEYELLHMTSDSDILHGALQRDLEKHSNNEKVLESLSKYEEVFGELPASGTCKKEITFGLQLKPEWINSATRSKCFPMSKADSDEIEKQVEELSQGGLVEEFKGREFPKYLSPAFFG